MCSLIQGLVLHHQVYLTWFFNLGMGPVLGHPIYQVFFSTFTSSSQSGDAHGPHVPFDPTNASTFGASGFTKLGTLGVASSVELQAPWVLVSSTELQYSSSYF